MKCLILAAGYATRLYPITELIPKPLLIVKDKRVLDWLVDDIEMTGEIDEYIIISNHKFSSHFRTWSKTRHSKITVIDDGTISNESRLGAVKDIQLVFNSIHLNDNILVVAGDNLLDFSLKFFLTYIKEKEASCIMRYFEPNTERLQKSGVVEIDQNEHVLSMEEKPATPKSNWCCPPFYYFTLSDCHIITKVIEGGCGFDAPGSLIECLCGITPIYAMEMLGKRYDIGDVKSYERVKVEFKGIIRYT